MLKKKILSWFMIVPIICFSGLTNIEMIDTPMAKVEQKDDSKQISNFNVMMDRQVLVREEVEPEIVAEVEIEEEIIEDVIEVVEEVYYEPNYNPYNLLEPSNITDEQAYQMLEGSALQSLYRAYTYAEEVYGVSAIFLMALSSEESAHGRSSLAISNNNLSGMKTRDGGWAYFSNWQESLEFTANMIRYEYLDEDGLFFNGYSIWNVNTKYCEGYKWSDNINRIAYELLNKL